MTVHLSYIFPHKSIGSEVLAAHEVLIRTLHEGLLNHVAIFVTTCLYSPSHSVAGVWFSLGRLPRRDLHYTPGGYGHVSRASILILTKSKKVFEKVPDVCGCPLRVRATSRHLYEYMP